ncbi:MAG TPA: HNH endonuclease [Aestuariivirga sp.]|nr:HNH endonuclease [Aestuariivirga sp.]
MNRSKEKYDFWLKKFQHRDVVNVFKLKLFELFDNQCFRCGAADQLHIDHHIPRTLGGKLEPGNLVVLCRRCNNAKGTIAPDVFYGENHLLLLAPKLEKQRELFDFQWDWQNYNRDKSAYFLSIGVDSVTVERIFSDPNYDGYIEPDSEKVIYTVDVTDMVDETLERMFKPPTGQT